MLRTAWEIRRVKEPDAWTTFHTESVLGGALLARREYAQAAPLLRAGYQGMRQRLDKIPPRDKSRLAEAIERLVVLATETGKPDEAKSWRDEKSRLLGAGSTMPGSGKP